MTARYLFLLPVLFSITPAAGAEEGGSPPAPRVLAIPGDGSVLASLEGVQAALAPRARIGPWTFEGTFVQRGAAHAVFEDFTRRDGRLVLAKVGEERPARDYPKTAEPSSPPDPKSLYRGHSLAEVLRSESDLLADEVLTAPGDPDPAEVAAALPPMRRLGGAWIPTMIRLMKDRNGTEPRLFARPRGT